MQGGMQCRIQDGIGTSLPSPFPEVDVPEEGVEQQSPIHPPEPAGRGLQPSARVDLERATDSEDHEGHEGEQTHHDRHVA